MTTKLLKIRENVALAPLTTMQVGGAARFFVEASDEGEVRDALTFAKQKNLPIFILGGGSNLLVHDAGFGGLILKIAERGIEFQEAEETVSVTAAAGENWDEFVRICVERNLAGVECLSGIPGTVGATPIQNVGAYGQEVGETIASVRVLDRETLRIKNLSNADCGFAYRASIFNTTEQNRFIVLAVTFRLTPNNAPALRYADLQKYFADRKTAPNLAETRAAVLEIRRAKSMVIDQTDENHRSAGSFFKNPIVSKKEFFEIEQAARQLDLIGENQNVPHFPAANETVKIPAAWLIEKSGFVKGFTRGQVGISSRHTLAVVNRGTATASELTGFVREIQAKIREIFGVDLQPEPIHLGFPAETQ